MPLHIKYEESRFPSFEQPKPIVQVDIMSDTAEEALDCMEKIAEKFGTSLPWVAARINEQTKPIRKKETAADKNKIPAYVRDKALTLLTRTYGDPRTRDETRSLLNKYEVQKFGDIPLERSVELLADAEAIWSKIAGTPIAGTSDPGKSASQREGEVE